METLNLNSKQTGSLLSLLTLLVIVTIAPHAFAQVSYTDANDPHGPLEGFAWTVGLATAGAVSGLGVWASIRYRR